jgi:hypoxanthine phosphoribosyltransferase
MNKLVIKNKEFKKLVSKIAREIEKSKWRPDYIVGLTRGGLYPAVLLSHYFDCTMHTLNVSLRDGDDLGPESNLWMAEDAFGYVSQESYPVPEGTVMSDATLRKNILIVDDINDTGATINWIMQDWASGCLPNDPAWKDVWNNNVKFAVIVDNLSSKCDAKMDYAGMEINKAEDDVWVEFPYEEWWTK